MTQRGRGTGGGAGRTAPATIPEDRLSMIWALAVPVIFALVILLSFAGIPSRFFPGPTEAPLPSAPASASLSVPPSASPSVRATPEASPSGSPAASPTATPQ